MKVLITGGLSGVGALIARHVADLFPTQTSRFDLAQAARRGQQVADPQGRQDHPGLQHLGLETEPDPDARHDRRREADEPCVAVGVSRAGLATHSLDDAVCAAANAARKANYANTFGSASNTAKVPNSAIGSPAAR